MLPLTLHTVYVPWRDDPRPASGLLQGVYAHLGIARFRRGDSLHANRTPEAYDSGVLRLAFDPDGKTLMVLQSGGPLWLWHVPT